MKIKIIWFLTSFVVLWLTVTAEASLPFIPRDEVQKGYDLADSLLKDKDAQGLIELVESSNYIVKQRAALHLGRLGAKEALPILKEKDLEYPRDTSISLGAFYVAIILLENDSVESRRQALLTTARTGFKDIDEVEEYRRHRISKLENIRSFTPAERRKRIDSIEKRAGDAKECILKGAVFKYYTTARGEAAAEYLLEYADESVIEKLKPIRSYGAQYVVLSYRCGQLKKTEAIELCINILGKHETPQKAESAQRLLESFGQEALGRVRRLMKEHEKQIDAPPPPFSIHHTIVRRCNRIMKAIEGDKPAFSTQRSVDSDSSERTARTREQEFIWQLSNGTPQEKMDAATQLKQMRSMVAVPYLLVEMRDKYGPIIYEDDPDSDDPHKKLAFVIRDGKKVPYVDYHEPLFVALAELAIPYFGPDRKWYEALEAWVRHKNMGDLLDKLTSASKKKDVPRGGNR